MKVIGATLAVILIAVVIVAIGMWRGLIPIPSGLLPFLLGDGEPERTARYFPPDTLAYSWATLAPAGGQLQELQDIWERLDDSRAFRNLVETMQEGFEDETAIDFGTDVWPWIGPEIAVGLLDVDWRGEEWVVAGMVGVRDHRAAEEFLRDWLDYMADEYYTEFDDETYAGFDIVVSDDGLQAYALTEDWLVFATSERGLEDILARLAGDEEDSLAKSEHFVEARSQLSERRFASVYFSLVEARDLLADIAHEAFGNDPSVWEEGEDVEWIAGSAGVAESGVVLELVSPLGIDHPLELADLDDPSRLLSDDTLGFVAMTFDPNVDHWRGAMRRYKIGELLSRDQIDELEEAVGAFANQGGESGDVRLREEDGLDVLLDLGLIVSATITGIALEDDLLDHLGGELIVAVGEVDFDASSGSRDQGTVDAVAMVSYAEGRKDDLARTIDDAVDRFAGLTGLDTDTQDVGADDPAVVFDLDDLMDEGDAYRPGYVLHRGYWTIGSTERSLEGVVARQNGDADALLANDEYQRALGLPPEKRQFLAYVDLHRIIRQMEPEDLDMNRDQYRVLEDSIGAIAVSFHSPHCAESSGAYECEIPPGADVSRYTAVLTLFPE